ncbi:MAG: NAD(+)/NADH kinase [Mycoplasmoidaceae bacterium]|nr:NAD(+)/NADH kinase [Mycoplasmoidaceae bacterium]
MTKTIQNFKLFINENERVKSISYSVQRCLEDAHFTCVDSNYDLAIAIGGDGSFLRMVKENDFNEDIYYVGINAGTLGFLQEVKFEEINQFIQKLKDNSYEVASLGIQETTVYTENETHDFKSLNEIVVRNSLLDTCHFDVKIENRLLEHYAGDGMLIATSTGSTAYNLSFGGSIVFDDFHTLQLTPIAPLNSKAYCSLRNSLIIPENRMVTLLPRNKENKFMVTVDGMNASFSNVQKIDTVVKQKRIPCLRFSNTFVDKVYDKFLS